MKPFWWREARTSERTTFSFSPIAPTRAVVLALIALVFASVAVFGTRAAFRDRAWLAGILCVFPFDVVALAFAASAVTMMNRTRIVIDGTHVVWTNGPMFVERARMTFAEATTLAATERATGRGMWTSIFSYVGPDGKPVKLGGPLQDGAHARWVIDQIDRELTKREPGIQTRRSTAGSPSPE